MTRVPAFIAEECDDPLFGENLSGLCTVAQSGCQVKRRPYRYVLEPGLASDHAAGHISACDAYADTDFTAHSAGRSENLRRPIEYLARHPDCTSCMIGMRQRCADQHHDAVAGD
jgi:hypothetical protein